MTYDNNYRRPQPKRVVHNENYKPGQGRPHGKKPNAPENAASGSFLAKLIGKEVKVQTDIGLMCGTMVRFDAYFLVVTFQGKDTLVNKGHVITITSGEENGI